MPEATEYDHFLECVEHGRQQSALVCEHVIQSLGNNQVSGFWWAAESAGNERPDAWCSQCESMVNQQGEWTEKTVSYAGVKRFCGLCYDDVKELNLGSTSAWWPLWK